MSEQTRNLEITHYCDGVNPANYVIRDKATGNTLSIDQDEMEVLVSILKVISRQSRESMRMMKRRG